MRRQLSRWGVAAAAVLVVSALVPTGSSAGAASTTASSTTTAASPRDGRVVVANANTNQIETLNPDGSAVLAVSPPGEVAIQPAWAPDGSRVVFVGDHAGPDFRVFTVKPDGTGMQQVGNDPEGYGNVTPTYTPNGQRIIYTRCRPEPLEGCALYSMRTNGQDKHAVTAYSGVDRNDSYPDVSPDGGRIAFTRSDNGILSQVWVARIDGSHAHAITTPRLEAGAPAWTKDGHHLLVTSDWAHVGENVYRIRDDGAQVTKLTSRKFPHNAQYAVPSPSGTKIMYSDDQAYPQIIGDDLFLMNPDGSGKHAITSDGRLLDADWGTAPLVKTGSVTSPYATAKASTVRPTPNLPRRLGVTNASSSTESRKWSR